MEYLVFLGHSEAELSEEGSPTCRTCQKPGGPGGLGR